MRPDLVEGAQELRDLLGEGRRLFELALTEVLVRERLLDALDHLVGLGRGVEGALGPTAAHHQAHCCRRIADKTPRHGSTRLSTARHQAQAEPRTMQHNHTRATTVRIPPKANTLSAPSRTPVPLKPNTIGAKRRVCSCDAYVLFGFRSTRGRLTAFSCAMILLSDLSSLPCEGAGPAVRQRCSDRRPGGAIWRPAAGLRRSSSAAQRGRRRRP